MKKVMEKPVKILRLAIDGISVDKAFKLTKSEGLIIISNKRADQLLNGEGLKGKSVRGAWPIHTGTMTAYTEPYQKLGATVEYTDHCLELTWIFEVPYGIGLRGLKNTILAVEHPNYDLEVDTKKMRVIVTPQKKLIIPVENFPSKNGWYTTDPVTAIPINKPLDSNNSDARYLYRMSQRVAPVIRSGYGYGFYGCYDGDRRDVVVSDVPPSNSFGVLVEAKESK